MSNRDLDPLEQRLSDALRGQSQPRPDVDDFLTDIHSGARRRRRRRQGIGGAAAALVVIAGTAVVGQSGLFDTGGSPASSDHTSAAATSPSPQPTGPTQSAVTPTALNTRVLSVTSTGSDHQWALGRTTDASCPRGACATVFERETDGTWTPLDPIPSATAGLATGADAVDQLRFVGSAESGYDAYAFGPGLFSAHGITADSGPSADSWNAVRLPGATTAVDALEAHGSTAYALVEVGDNTSELVVSPTDQDAFSTVVTGHQLQHARDLNVSSGVVAFLSSAGDVDHVVSSTADATTGVASGPWQVSQPCGGGGVRHLSTAANTLWALCADGTLDTTTVGGSGAPSWRMVPRQMADPTGPLAALSDTSALATTSAGLVEYEVKGTSRTISARDFRDASMLGFTNDNLGFAISRGLLWRTDDGGSTWSIEKVTGTG